MIALLFDTSLPDQSAGPRRPTRTSRLNISTYLASIALVLALAIGAPRLSDPIAMTTACLAILIGGLPHGALDVAHIARSGHHGRVRIVLVYLAIGAVMALLWRAVPTVALAVFLAVATLHFAEDWRGQLSSFPPLAFGGALVAAPMLLHGAAVGGLFVDLTGQQQATGLATLGTLIAPVVVATAAAGIAILFSNRRHDDAVAALVSLVALTLLPPVVGFALFFCLIHSPRQLAAVREALGYRARADGAGELVALTLLALGLAAGIALVASGPTISITLVRAAFITLSVLAVPHMLTAGLLEGLRRVIERIDWQKRPAGRTSVPL